MSIPADLPVRSLVLWFPDWPITALIRDAASVSAVDPERPIAIVRGNAVIACSARARREGVRRGQRRRDAQAACPDLQIVAEDPARDQRGFLPVVEAIEGVAPGVQIVRPGLCALRVRGPARYYGGELPAATALLDALAALGLIDIRAGIADGPFTAEQAARLPWGEQVRIVAPGEAESFLAPLSIAVLGDSAIGDAPEIIGLLARLGVHTLAEYAALDLEKVRDRLGERGVRLHALAGGQDSRPVTPRVPPPELARQISFEPPLELVDQVAFAVRMTADDFIRGLGAASLVCTELRVELTAERGERSERVWLHPTSFDPAEVVDRVRWQLQAAIGAGKGDLQSPIAEVRLVPEAVDAAAHHAPGLFGQGAEERVHHALSRVQAMLGHRGVVTPALSGGRWLSERQVLVPWGDRAAIPRERSQPWPGSLPAPWPTTVFFPPPTMQVTSERGEPLGIDERGLLIGSPTELGGQGGRRAITAWAGPWPVREREWDAERQRRAYRLQVVDADQTAWMLFFEDGSWSAEGRYD